MKSGMDSRGPVKAMKQYVSEEEKRKARPIAGRAFQF